MLCSTLISISLNQQFTDTAENNAKKLHYSLSTSVICMLRDDFIKDPAKRLILTINCRSGV